jgi:uncharacterized protein YdhG (YjbR/CyaY superfamily)
VREETASGGVDLYVAKLPPEAREAVERLRTIVREIVPGVTERISYGMPTFDLDGRYVVYLAGWKKHVALYPVTPGLAAELGEELAPYRSGKGSLRFSLGAPLPVDLIRRIVGFRAGEVAAAG